MEEKKKMSYWGADFDISTRQRKKRDWLQELIPSSFCVPSSKSMRSVLREALESQEFNLVCPVCPDWSHQNGRYTFEGVGEGVGHSAMVTLSRLAVLLQQIGDRINEIKIFLADIEVIDPTLKHLGISPEEFLSKAQKSREAIKDDIERNIFICDFHFSVDLMTCLLPSSYANKVEGILKEVERFKVEVDQRNGYIKEILRRERGLYARQLGIRPWEAVDSPESLDLAILDFCLCRVFDEAVKKIGNNPHPIVLFVEEDVFLPCYTSPWIASK